jgi:cell division transport system permease protein
MEKKVEKYNKRGVRTSYVSTVIGISLVLFMMGLVIGGVLGLETIQRNAKESLQVDIFFRPNTSITAIKQIEQELKTWDKFKEVFYVSPEGAIEEFSGSGQDAKEILSIFDGENPLPPTLGFRPKAIYANKAGMLKIKKQLLTVYGDEIEEVSYEEASVKSVNLGFKQFVYLIGVISLLLIIVAVAMINNTIRLALYSKRFTVKTMQLVGATNAYIRRPFLFQAIIQGIVSSIIGLALLAGLFYALNNVLESVEIKFDEYSFILLISSILSIGLVITFVSTWLALNKFLRMKLDDLY